MFCPTFVLTNTDVRAIDTLLECLTRLNLQYLYSHPDTPAIYESGVRYQREKAGKEEWLDIPEILKRGIGDCEDLSCWLAAEYRAKGIMAKAFASRMPTRSSRPLFHVRVRLGDGKTIEDPSKLLGM